MYRDRIYNFVSGALKLVGIILFLYLSLCAFTYTEYMDPLRGGAEFPIVIAKYGMQQSFFLPFFSLRCLNLQRTSFKKKH